MKRRWEGGVDLLAPSDLGRAPQKKAVTGSHACPQHNTETGPATPAAATETSSRVALGSESETRSDGPLSNLQEHGNAHWQLHTLLDGATLTPAGNDFQRPEQTLLVRNGLSFQNLPSAAASESGPLPSAWPRVAIGRSHSNHMNMYRTLSNLSTYDQQTFQQDNHSLATHSTGTNMKTQGVGYGARENFAASMNGHFPTNTPFSDIGVADFLDHIENNPHLSNGIMHPPASRAYNTKIAQTLNHMNHIHETHNGVTHDGLCTCLDCTITPLLRETQETLPSNLNPGRRQSPPQLVPTKNVDGTVGRTLSTNEEGNGDKHEVNEGDESEPLAQLLAMAQRAAASEAAMVSKGTQCAEFSKVMKVVNEHVATRDQEDGKGNPSFPFMDLYSGLAENEEGETVMTFGDMAVKTTGDGRKFRERIAFRPRQATISAEMKALRILIQSKLRPEDCARLEEVFTHPREQILECLHDMSFEDNCLSDSIRERQLEFLTKFTDTIVVPTCMIDRGTGIMYANESFCQMLKISKGRAKSSSYLQLLHPDTLFDTTAVLASHLQNIGKAKQMIMDVTFCRNDGEPVLVRAAINLQRDVFGIPSVYSAIHFPYPNVSMPTCHELKIM